MLNAVVSLKHTKVEDASILDSKGTNGLFIILSFALKRSSDSLPSEERFGAKLRVTENLCVLFDFSTFVC